MISFDYMPLTSKRIRCLRKIEVLTAVLIKDRAGTEEFVTSDRQDVLSPKSWNLIQMFLIHCVINPFLILTTEARVLSQCSPFGIYDLQSDFGTCFSPSTSVSPLSIVPYYVTLLREVSAVRYLTALTHIYPLFSIPPPLPFLVCYMG